MFNDVKNTKRCELSIVLCLRQVLLYQDTSLSRQAEENRRVTGEQEQNANKETCN